MRKKQLLTAVLISITLMLFSAGIYAATAVPDVIQLDTKAYVKNEKGPVNFNHRKHQLDYKKNYPQVYKVSCGECHHDQNNQPRKSLKEGDKVEKCIQCHNKPEYAQDQKAKKLSKKRQLEYHANALHENCQGCHKKVNKTVGKKIAPTTCKKCHAQ